MSDLSILCVTRAEPHALSFLRAMRSVAFATGAELVVAADGVDATLVLQSEFGGRVVTVKSKGYIESVLDEAVGACATDYVLRLDDDEKCSPAMVKWIAAGSYRVADHWKFPRANLWPTADQVAMTPHLWPDVQTRLSVRAKAGGRGVIHAGSPFGGGTEAPCVIEHHKFLVKTLEERRAIVRRYDAIQRGAGSHFLPFSCPEDAYPQGIHVGRLGDGTAARIKPQQSWGAGDLPRRVMFA